MNRASAINIQILSMDLYLEKQTFSVNFWLYQKLCLGERNTHLKQYINIRILYSLILVLASIYSSRLLVLYYKRSRCSHISFHSSLTVSSLSCIISVKQTAHSSQHICWWQTSEGWYGQYKSSDQYINRAVPNKWMYFVNILQNCDCGIIKVRVYVTEILIHTEICKEQRSHGELCCIETQWKW